MFDIAGSSTLSGILERGNESCIEVLEPVPSYEEWEQTQNWADFTKDYHGLREKLEIAEYENAQLKELLKECRDEIEYLRKHYKGNIDHFKNNTRLDKKINQALGEDK